MKPKISVIVPIYNGEKYISKCLNSLWNQTYQNMEIILVNDGSTDKTKQKILKEIKNKQNVIYLENKTNQGTSKSRNIALKKASGIYIGYIDSDDYIDKNYYESLMDSILKEKKDIAVCGIDIIENDESTKKICGGSKLIDFINNGLAASPCNKLIKKEILEKYPFLEGTRNEDVGVIFPVLINHQNICYNEKVFYHYIQHSSSFQNQTFNEKRFDIFENIELAFSRIEDKKQLEKYKDLILFHQLIPLLFYGISKEENFHRRKQFLKIFLYKN